MSGVMGSQGRSLTWQGVEILSLQRLRDTPSHSGSRGLVGVGWAQSQQSSYTGKGVWDRGTVWARTQGWAGAWWAEMIWITGAPGVGLNAGIVPLLFKVVSVYFRESMNESGEGQRETERENLKQTPD